MNKKTIAQQCHNSFFLGQTNRSHQISREELTLSHIVLTDCSRPAPHHPKPRKLPFFITHKKQKAVKRPPSNVFTSKGIIEGVSAGDVWSQRPYRRINSCSSHSEQVQQRSKVEQIRPIPFNFTRPKTARRQYSQSVQAEARVRLCTPNKSQNNSPSQSKSAEKQKQRRTISVWCRPTQPKQEPLYFSAWETDPAEHEQYL